MRIASYNINGVKARLPRLLEWLQETRPSVACLQEVKSQDAGFPAEEFTKIGYRALFYGQKSFNGVAILADESLEGDLVETCRGLPGLPPPLPPHSDPSDPSDPSDKIDNSTPIGPDGEADEQARYLEAEIAGMRIASIYLPNGNPLPGPKFDYKLSWMQRLRARMQHLWSLEIPCAIVGDYNVIPQDTDVWAPKAMETDALMQPQSRDAYTQLLADGWCDAIATRNPRGGVWTYWDYQAGAWPRDHGFRIDHLLLSPELSARMQAVGVDREYRGREKASDHTPVWVEVA